jgi:hypothetical protein
MTGDPAAVAARAAAVRLSSEFGSQLPADVEAALYARGQACEPNRYIDLVELGSFLVSAASLAWQIYDSRRMKGEKPTAPVLAREVRVVQRERTQLDGTRERIIEVVASEVVNTAAEE